MKTIFTFLLFSFLFISNIQLKTKDVYFQIPDSEVIELNKLYESCNGENWFIQTGWPIDSAKFLPNQYPFGIGISTKLSVKEENETEIILEANIRDIRLPNNNLTGSIPEINFPELIFFNLHGNELSGSIPDLKLPILKELLLNNNKLSGSIPNLSIPEITAIILANNKLDGELPTFDYPVLKILDLSNNKLSGSIPNFNLPLIRELYLRNNSFSGQIPEFDFPFLQFLRLNNNYLTGKIPNFNISSIRLIQLSDNQLEGTNTDFNYPSLLYLYAGNNKFTFDFFSNLKNSVELVTDFQGQDTILPIQREGNKLIIQDFSASNFSNLNYNWYVNGHLIADVNSNSIDMKYNGEYKCIVETFEVQQSLKLTSETIKIANEFRELNFQYIGEEINEVNKIYNSTNGKNWVNNEGWPVSKGNLENGTIPMGLTFGFNSKTPIYEDDDISIFDVFISTVILSNNSLSGTLPDLDLPNLISLDLSINQLNSELPNLTIPQVKSLNFAENSFSGQFTEFEFPELVTINLNSNQISGNIPNFTSVDLEYINLQSNQFSGEIPDFKLPKLKYLRLDANTLSGSIPDFLLPELRRLELSNNNLDGETPNFNLPKLVLLNLLSNQLSGEVPSFSLPEARVIWLNGNNFSGNFPSINAKKCIELSIFGNKLSGTFPDLKIPGLYALAAYENNFTGNLPDLSGVPNISFLALHKNQFTGSIPNYDLKFLETVYFHNNKLSGELPKFNLNNLNILSLSNNNLTGIVRDFGSKNLRSLDLSNNELSGMSHLSTSSLFNFITTGNKITLGGLEVNFSRAHFYQYGSQDTTLALIRNGNELEVLTDGKFNTYSWFRDGIEIEGEFGKTLDITEFGEYSCIVKSKILPGVEYQTDRLEIITNVENDDELFVNIIHNYNELNIATSENSPFYVDIYSINGLKHYSKSSLYQNHKIDLSNYSPGTYFVRIKMNDKYKNKMITISN